MRGRALLSRLFDQAAAVLALVALGLLLLAFWLYATQLGPRPGLVANPPRRNSLSRPWDSISENTEGPDTTR